MCKPPPVQFTLYGVFLSDDQTIRMYMVGHFHHLPCACCLGSRLCVCRIRMDGDRGKCLVFVIDVLLGDREHLLILRTFRIPHGAVCKA